MRAASARGWPQAASRLRLRNSRPPAPWWRALRPRARLLPQSLLLAVPLFLLLCLPLLDPARSLRGVALPASLLSEPLPLPLLFRALAALAARAALVSADRYGNFRIRALRSAPRGLPVLPIQVPALPSPLSNFLRSLRNLCLPISHRFARVLRPSSKVSCYEAHNPE